VWQLREDSFDPRHLRYYESIFSLGNGYLGTRGSLEEPLVNSSPATLIAGVFDQAPGEVTELANVANWVGIEIWLDGIPVNIGQNKVISHQRILDLQSGILYRKSLLQIAPTCQIEIVSTRFVSVADLHLMGIRYSFNVRDSRPGKHALRVSAGFDGDVTNAGVRHFAVLDYGPWGEESVFLHQQALHSDHQVVLGSRLRLFKGGEIESARSEVKNKGSHVWTEMNTEVASNTQYTLEKTVTVYTSRDSKDPQRDAEKTLHNCQGTPLDSHIEKHRTAWAKLWVNADVEIKGDDAAQIALRFSIFHLLQASSETDDRVSVPAKALTGLGYKGHVFWDTEIFMLPYLNITHPLRSRNMLTYRYHTLGEARKKAEQKGFKGALFAWESADTGEETTPQFVKHLKQDKQITIWSGVSEHHVASDVAFAVWQYFVATADTEFILSYGAEIILDTARFWSSRASYNRDKDRYDILRVIGPDEYHENVDNNFFTNAMAQWNIRKGLEIYRHLKNRYPSDWTRITTCLDLQEKEIDEWADVANKMFIQIDEEKRVFVQFDGFMELKDIDLNKYADRTQPMDVVLSPEEIQKSRINKQPDVLMIFSLLRQEFPRKVMKTNWDFYEPLCGHGSSLSPAIHSLIASDIGLPAKAYEYFVRGSEIDLHDKMGNTEHGVHAATAGGLLQAAVYGFAGLRLTEEGIIVDPRLPDHWQSMRFNIWYRGKRIGIFINH
jgi:trehalose/maltose hydrolase-like predicted phosphorylase